MSKVIIIEDDAIMAECLKYAIQKAISDSEYSIEYYTNAFLAMESLNQSLPDLIILDILLDGPDGFSFLNELVSYSDTAKVPVIIVSSLDLHHHNLSHYGVIATFQKATLLPEQITTTVQECLNHA